MSIDLSQLRIAEDPPEIVVDDPLGGTWEKRSLQAFLDGARIGYLNVRRALTPTGTSIDEQLFDEQQPIAYTSYRYVHPSHTRNGLSRHLTLLAHERYKQEIGPLHSDYNFLEEDPKKLWRDLERRGLAKHIPYTVAGGHRFDRWRML